MSELMLSYLILSGLARDSEAHRLLFLLTWLMRVHDVLIFSDEAKDGESSEVTKTFIMDYVSPIVEADLLIIGE